jgi:hypothetical protein
MTIGSNTARVSFNTDGSTVVFPVAIQAYLATDFLAILTNNTTGAETVLTLNSDYTLSQAGTLQPPAWSLTTLSGQFASPFIAGSTLQVILNPSETQQTQYQQGQAFPSLALQTNLDRLTQMAIRLTDQIGRALAAPDGDVSPVMTLPPAKVRAGLIQAYDVNGNLAFLAPSSAPYSVPFLSVLTYGADPTGARSSTIAITQAINAAAAAGGGNVFFPAGTYLWTSASPVVIPQGVTILGSGKNASIITTNNVAASIFYLSGTGASIRDLGFTSSVVSTGGVWVELAGQDNTIDNFSMNGDFNGIKVIGVSSTISNGYFTSGAPGATRIVLNCGDAAPTIFNVTMAAQAAPYPSAGIELQNCTSLLASNLEIIQQGACLAITPGAGQSCDSDNFVECFFDSGSYSVYCQTAGSGAISRLTFLNTWGGDGANGGWLFNNAGGGVFSGVSLVECSGCVNGGAGVSINGPVTNFKIIGGTYAQNTNSGIAAAQTGDIKVIGADCGSYAGLSGNSAYGISLGANLTAALVTACGLVGNNAPLQDVTVGAIPKIIKDNPGYNPLQPTVITPTGSPFTYENLSGGPVLVFVDGGTVSNVTLAGLLIATASNFVTLLPQGVALVVTYSAAPTMKYQGL